MAVSKLALNNYFTSAQSRRDDKLKAGLPDVLIRRKAIEFIDKNSENPFFCYSSA
jgi:hypothetical protein